MSDTPRGLKLSCCGNHPERTDLSCYKIRRLDGTALTVAEVWAELTVAHAEIAELRAKCEKLSRKRTYWKTAAKAKANPGGAHE